MQSEKGIWHRLKPGVSRQWLHLMAALVWTFAGGMLLWKGVVYSGGTTGLVWKVPLGLVGGVVFYLLVFRGLSAKHSRRIVEMEPKRPCVFSFFSWRSYLMMVLMVSMGITLKRVGLIPPAFLPLVYFTMGIPLLLS